MRPYWKGSSQAPPFGLVPDRTSHRLLERRAHRLPADQQGDRSIVSTTTDAPPLRMSCKTAGRWTGDITARIVHADEALSPAVERAG